ncbi:MAG: hypothetical protein QOD11_2200 [Bradyrhizobium sp.]|nr:hypothetical protein [Bradyrhizobium sp.]
MTSSAWTNRLRAMAGLPPYKDRYSSEERKIFDATRQISLSIIVIGAISIGWVYLWAHGLSQPQTGARPSILAILGADLLVATAAAAAGACFGFIFGIPRTLDPASRVAVATAATQAAPAVTSNAVMAANTNLERISDWLTTLLIGATLVQIKDIAKWVGALGSNLLAGGAAANDAIVPIIVILFFCLGFLGIYLITRLYLTSAFLQALGMLSGIPPTGPAPIAGPGRRTLPAPPASFLDLKAALAAAASSSTAADWDDALGKYHQFTFKQNESSDFQLNADVARILAKIIAAGSPAGGATASSDLKAALTQAAQDPATKTALQKDLAAGGLATKNQALDADIATILN